MILQEKDLEDYFNLLRFQTIGADPMKLRDCVQCAMWLKKLLEENDFTCELLQAPNMLGTPPVVLAERPGSPDTPTVLFYGHYDVQPPDPLDEWRTPPFQPTVGEDGRFYARGSQDDKGQFFGFFCGIRALIEAGDRIPTIKVVLEGQEESGSGALSALAPSLSKRLRADVLAVCDTSAAKDLQPAIVAGLRGVGHFTLRLTAASRDLHSGEYGGIAPNPAQGMAELIASLHNPDGSIAVEGFTSGIEPPTAAELRAAEEAGMSADEYAEDIGCGPFGGETALSPVERNSFRPTIEVNGIHTGYGGPGSKTVIPASAIAKLSMRLVPGQNPKRALKAIEEHLAARVPKGMTLAIEEVTGLSPALRLPMASPLFRLAADVLEQITGRKAVFQWDGASIPVVALLREVSGAAPLLVGWGQPQDRIHSPNESYSPEQFAMSKLWAEAMLSALAG